MIVEIVRYKSALPPEEVAERFDARADAYRSVPGLLQKYYVHFTSTDEYGGVYVWASPEASAKWRETQLAETLEETYQIQQPPSVELADVMLVLHER